MIGKSSSSVGAPEVVQRTYMDLEIELGVRRRCGRGVARLFTCLSLKHKSREYEAGHVRRP